MKKSFQKKAKILVHLSLVGFLLTLLLSYGTIHATEKASGTPPLMNQPMDLILQVLEAQEDCGTLQQKTSDYRFDESHISEIKRSLSSLTSKPIAKSPLQKQEINLLKFLHAQSHCFISRQFLNLLDPALAWDDLIDMIHPAGETSPEWIPFRLTVLWMTYLKEESDRLSALFQIPFQPAAVSADMNVSFIRFQNTLVTPGMASMWQHCRKRFQQAQTGWSLNLVSGFISPAVQFVQFVKKGFHLQNAVASYPASGYGMHQSEYPNLQVALLPVQDQPDINPWEMLNQNCMEFGFQVETINSKHTAELSFPGIETLYQEIFSNPLIPFNIARDLPTALHNTGFYPSPRGLRAILALSAQESTMQWNPKLNSQKKTLLRKRFNSILLKINDAVPGSVTRFFLSKNHKQRLDTLIAELHYMTDPANEGAREYDFYLWSRKTLAFITELTEEYKQIAKLGQWWFDLHSVIERLNKEPQTFGLWQINVNHLVEKIASFQQLRRAFPEIYQKTEGKWLVNRTWLVDALSGRRDARLDRKRTLELIIHTHLKPRYENHLLGEKEDLLFFIAENMSGEMSTYRAAVQKALNDKMKRSLQLDGDLTFYRPYSTHVDWNKKSQTVQTLQEFIHAHHYYFKKPVEPELLIRAICQADSWDGLRRLELYQKVTGRNAIPRIFPEIKSSLYNQTPYQYAKIVEQKSLLF